jgi:hypothetical protein
MSELSGFALLHMDSSNGGGITDDSVTPRIVKNIDRISNKYREYIKSEITEGQDSQSEQAEKVKRLNESDKRPKTPKR